MRPSKDGPPGCGDPSEIKGFFPFATLEGQNDVILKLFGEGDSDLVYAAVGGGEDFEA